MCEGTRAREKSVCMRGSCDCACCTCVSCACARSKSDTKIRVAIADPLLSFRFFLRACGFLLFDLIFYPCVTERPIPAEMYPRNVRVCEYASEVSCGVSLDRCAWQHYRCDPTTTSTAKKTSEENESGILRSRLAN